MNDNKIEQMIREYISQVIHMSLVTTSENRPWVCEVHFAYDDELNLFFASSLDRRHSKEIMDNQYVAGNIVTQHHKNQKVRGVYFEGVAELLQDIDQTHPAYKAYTQRFEDTGSLLGEIKKDGAAGLFKITIQNYYVFDSYGEKRGKHKLVWHSEKQS